MWYVQVNQSSPQRLNSTKTTPGRSVETLRRWTFNIPSPENLKILYIFNPLDDVKQAHSVQITVGSLPPFHLGVLSHDTPALQTEPNFPIQRGTRCTLTICETPTTIPVDPRRVAQLKQGLTVNSFDGHFQHFMDALS